MESMYWVWFQLMFGIGTSRSHALMEYFSHPQEIADGIRAGNRVVTMLRPQELAAWETAWDRARELDRRTRAKGCEVITPDHPNYPAQLRNIYGAPAALYVKGDLACLQDTLAIGMVGTRTHTGYGQEAAKKLAGELAACGAVIISGLAKGIDTICHHAALAAGGKSIGILGCGLDVDYPKGSAAVKKGLAENGAVVSEFPLGTKPMAGHFPMRNRLISGMAHGVIVVEADMQSGSMITAAHALEQNRELFAVPGDIFSVRAQGAHKLIREGAKLTVCAEDVLEEFSAHTFPQLKPPMHKTPERGAVQEEGAMVFAGSKMPPVETAAQPEKTDTSRKELLEACSEDGRAIYAMLGQHPTTLESVAAGSPLEIARIQTALTELEIYGLIKGYPGRRFSL